VRHWSHSEAPDEPECGRFASRKLTPGRTRAPGNGGDMGNRARKAKRAGRARFNRIDRDFARTGDQTRFALALLAACGNGEASALPSNWNAAPVEFWRTTYTRLLERGIQLWKPWLEACNRFVTVNGVRFDLHAVAKHCEALEGMESDERERALDFYAKCSADLTPDWIQKVDD